MDEILNEEMPTEETPTEETPAETIPAAEEEVKPIRTRRRKQAPAKPKLSFRMPAFLANYISHLGEDVRWYFDIRLWSPLILLLLLLALIPGKQKAAPAEAVPETIPVETMPVMETQPAAEPIDPDAAALAVLADSVGSGRSKNAKEIIMWVAINRMEDRANGYGMSLQEEIERANQWQGYDPAVAYSEESYEIAKKVLDIVENGDLRPLDPGMLWLVLNDNGSVTVRNQFTANANQKWVEKTVK